MRLNFKTIIQTAPALLLAAGLTTTSVAPAQAFFFDDPSVKREVNHLVECIELAFSDPAKHTKECSPSRPGAPVTRDEPENPIVILPALPTQSGDECDISGTSSLSAPRGKYLVAALTVEFGQITKSDAHDFDAQPRLLLGVDYKGEKPSNPCDGD